MADYTPTYSFYVSVYGGKLDEDTFLSSLPQAVPLVDDLIWPNVVTEDTAKAYKKAICSAVNALVIYGDDTGKDFTIGSFSVRNSSATVSADVEARARARCHLTGTGLLHMGVW